MAHQGRRLAGFLQGGGAQVAAEKTVVRNDHHRGLRPRQLQVAPQHQVMVDVAAVQHVPVDLEVGVADVRHLGGPVPHELMAQAVDGVVIDRQQVPVGLLRQVGAGGVHRGAFRQVAGQGLQAPVLLLVDAPGFGDEKLELFEGQVRRVGPEVLHHFVQRGRGHRRRVKGPLFEILAVGVAEIVANHRAPGPARRMAGVPAHHRAAHFPAAEDGPEGLGLQRGAGYRPHPLAVGPGLDEAVDPVAIGPFARGDAGPEHGGQYRLQGRQVAHHPAVDQPFQMGHVPCIQQRLDDLPVSSVPTQQQNPFGQALAHS